MGWFRTLGAGNPGSKLKSLGKSTLRNFQKCFFLHFVYYTESVRLNSHGKHQKAYLSFGTDLAHMIDVTESLMIGNENIDQNVQLEWEIFFYQ